MNPNSNSHDQSALGKIALFVLAAWALWSALPAEAFHEGGSAECDGCHTMHNQGGGIANAFLLQAAGPSAVCLNCHEGTTVSDYRVATAGSVLIEGQPPLMMTPGGDFAWLKKNYSWLSGTIQTEYGNRHGHNIIAPEFGYQPDSFNVTAPGGTFSASNLHCTSCHDPHGRFRVLYDGTVGVTGASISSSGSYSYNGSAQNPLPGSAVGAYRLLAGVGYQPSSSFGSVFSYNPPAAMAPSEYNRSESMTQTRVVYGNGVSLWCANCHGNFPGHVGTTFNHPVDTVLGAEIASHYNAYLKTGDLSGTDTKSFLSLVPFESPLGYSSSERNTMADMARNDDTNLVGPTSQDRVGCLTCHRAHASGWRSALRWNNDSQLLVYNGNYPGINNGAPVEYSMGRTESETRRAYYDRPPEYFAVNQNRLCEKCHAQQ